MIRNRTLRVLSRASITSRDPGLMPSLPSWVPDWTCILNRHLLIRANTTSKFSAGTSKDMVVWFSNDTSLVHVEGAIIDSIEVVGSEPCSMKTTSLFEIDKLTLDRFNRLYLWLAECWYIARDGHHMTAGAYDAFWGTMLCGLDSTGHPAPEVYSRYFISYITLLAEGHQLLGAVIDCSDPLEVSGPSVSRRFHRQAASIGILPKNSSAVRRTFTYGSRRICKSAPLSKTSCRSGVQVNGSVVRLQIAWLACRVTHCVRI